MTAKGRSLPAAASGAIALTTLTALTLVSAATLAASDFVSPAASTPSASMEVPFAAVAPRCPEAAAGTEPPVGARYAIRTSERTVDGRVTARDTGYGYVRRGRTVLHDYPSAGIAEAFTRTANGQIRMTRYFDAHERAIEYDPSDRRSLAAGGAAGEDWTRLSSMFDPRVRETLERVATEGEGCTRVERLVREDGRGRVELDWLPAWGIAARYAVETPERRQRWTLEQHLVDATRIDAELARRDGYRAIDFADVGDSESDPFVRSMIELGFVEHGASGFYDSSGRPLGGNAHGAAHMH